VDRVDGADHASCANGQDWSAAVCKKGDAAHPPAAKVIWSIGPGQAPVAAGGGAQPLRAVATAQ
jgi:hypothetical protein